jgi:hypothetical protein
MTSLILATSHAHRGLIWGIFSIASGLLHLVYRRFYARRNAAVNTARRETAISPLRRTWLYWPSTEQSSLVWGTVVSAAMFVAGIALVLLSL